eukprot:RCo002499
MQHRRDNSERGRAQCNTVPLKLTFDVIPGCTGLPAMSAELKKQLSGAILRRLRPAGQVSSHEMLQALLIGPVRSLNNCLGIIRQAFRTAGPIQGWGATVASMRAFSLFISAGSHTPYLAPTSGG